MGIIADPEISRSVGIAGVYFEVFKANITLGVHIVFMSATGESQ